MAKKKEPMTEAEAEEAAEMRSEMANRDYTQTSPSGRTTISVEMAANGKAVITVDRDGHRVHRVDFEREPDEKVGT
jgi:hypothetical protein